MRLSHQATGGLDKGKCTAYREEIQVISAIRRARLLYSASVLERETRGCFFDCHDIRFGPRKTQYPEVERLSLGSDAQSASQKPSKVIAEEDLAERSYLSQRNRPSTLRCV